MGCCLSREDDRFNSGSEALLPKGRSGNKRVENSVDVDFTKKEGANGTYKSPSAVVAAGDVTSNVSAKSQLPKKAVESVDLLGLDDKTSTPLVGPMTKIPSVPNSISTVEPTSILSGPTAAPIMKKANSLQKPVTKEPSLLKSTHALAPKPTESLLPKRAKLKSSKDTNTSPKTLPDKPMETENEELVVSAFTSVSVKTEDCDNDNSVSDSNGNEDTGNVNDKDNENEDTGNVNDKDNENNGSDGKCDNDGKAMSELKDLKPKKNISSKKSKKKRKKGKK